jgi:hypothetical protein
LLFGGEPPLAISPPTCPTSGAERHPVTNLPDKLLFEDVFVGGDAHIAPVVLLAKPHCRRQ